MSYGCPGRGGGSYERGTCVRINLAVQFIRNIKPQQQGGAMSNQNAYQDANEVPTPRPFPRPSPLNPEP